MAKGFILPSLAVLFLGSSLMGMRMSLVMRPMARESRKGFRKGRQLAIML